MPFQNTSGWIVGMNTKCSLFELVLWYLVLKRAFSLWETLNNSFKNLPNNEPREYTLALQDIFLSK